MNEKEALERIKTGNFNNGSGFDMQLLIDAVGTIGEMLRSGQISEIVRCKDCKHCDPENHMCDCGHTIQWQLPRPDYWFCADGERREE